MKIQYSNKRADRVAYMECQTNALFNIDFSEFADDPDFCIFPIFGKMGTNIIYTNRDFMKKAQIFSSKESNFLVMLSNNLPSATLIVVD